MISLCGTLLLAGLAGSLHCVGMCGPILFGFARATASPGARDGRADFFAYHAGRIWTYGLLGLLAGLGGGRLKEMAGLAGWQRGVGVVLATLVLASGVLLLGLLPARLVEGFLSACGAGRLLGTHWFRLLATTRGVQARLLLGAVMGFLPCGLVYAMLMVSAGLPTPAHSALAMVAFGAGTVPSLTAVLLLGRSIAPRIRVQGTRLVALGLILAGGVMLARALAPPGAHAHHDMGPVAEAAP